MRWSQKVWLPVPVILETLAGMSTQTHQIRNSWIVQRSPIFYGWVVWLVASIGLFATSPGQSFSVSLFIDHYITDFGLDRTTVSGLYGLGTFVAALSLTWIGRQIDKRGNRFMSIIIAGLFALVLMACSLIAGPFAILLSFVAIRGLGQGSLGLVSTTAVAQWFQRRRGWVLGLSLVGFALFQRIYLPAMQSYIDAHGWRAAWVISGLTMGLLVLPLLAIFLRDRPEDFGLLPDGERTDGTSDFPTIIEENWALREALRTPVLWVFTFARVLAGAWGTALVFHQLSIYEGLGYSGEFAAATYGQAALMTAVFTLVAGRLVDRIKPGYMIAMHMGGLIVACGLALIMTQTWMVFLYTVAFGVFMGMGAVFDGTVWVNLFGRQHQGAIRGFIAMMGVAGTAIGPLIYGVSYDYFGGYAAGAWLGMVLAGLAIIMALIVRIPRKATE